jgi:cell division protein FtsB
LNPRQTGYKPAALTAELRPFENETKPTVFSHRAGKMEYILPKLLFFPFARCALCAGIQRLTGEVYQICGASYIIMGEAMIEKFKSPQNYLAHLEQLRDVRTVGLLIFLVIVLLISWSGVKTIQTNYDLQRQISALEQENQVQQLKNNNLRLQNEYFNTNQYLELTARQNFGLGSLGETELIVPRNVALANTASLPTASAAPKPSSKQPFYQRNFQAWEDFLLNRQTSSN